MTLRILVAVAFIGSLRAFSQPLQISLIPDTLLQSAQAVIRYDSSLFLVKSPNSADFFRKYAITIFKPQKKSLALIILPYDQFKSTELVNASVYDKNGVLIRKLKNKEIEDVSLTDYHTIASDQRALKIDLRNNYYPYTIEIEYKSSLSGSMFYPTWMPLDDYEVSLEKSSFLCSFPVQLPVRFQESNVHFSSKSDDQITQKIYWNVPAIKAKSEERFSNGLTETVPIVWLAPSFFEMDGYKGELSTWGAYGDWINQVNDHRQMLSAEMKSIVMRITDSLKTDEDKIWKLYEFMQANTRYISIQLGIGGWQPYEASFVEEKKYGDCKALSNFMKSLLSVIGIPSDYSLIRAGNLPDLDENFPNAHFNHAILCVPNKGDTIWLECTSQTNPIGYQGSFTGNRHALVINESGGHIMRTKYYSTLDNLQCTKSQIILHEDGSAKINLELELNGLEIENGGFVHKYSAKSEDQKEWIKGFFDFTSMEVESYSFQLLESPLQNPIGKINTSFTTKECSKISGNRILINPNQFNQYPSLAMSKNERETDIVRRFGYVQRDSIQLTFPENYYPELIPKEVNFSSKYGSYKRKIVQVDKELIFQREFIFNSGEYPKEQYLEFTQFLKTITKYDSELVVFVNKT